MRICNLWVEDIQTTCLNTNPLHCMLLSVNKPFEEMIFFFPSRGSGYKHIILYTDYITITSQFFSLDLSENTTEGTDHTKGK